LISVGMLGQNQYTIHDLGRVVEEYREIDLMVGRNKRIFKDEIINVSELSERLFETMPLHLTYGMFGDSQLNDQTLPQLRELMMQMELIPKEEKRKDVVKKAQKNFKGNHKDKIASDKKSKYDQLRAFGYDSRECTKMSYWSLERIQLQLMEDNKL